MSSTTDLTAIEHEILAQIANAHDEATLEAVRVQALGKTGQISSLLKSLGSMEPEARKTFGAQVNMVKDKVTAALAERKNHMATAHLYARLKTETIDVTLPPRAPMPETGRVHPVSQVMDEVIAIFGDLGFSVAEGPDIETDQFNFTDLNFPEGHPAREMHDTFFLPVLNKFGSPLAGEQELAKRSGANSVGGQNTKTPPSASFHSAAPPQGGSHGAERMVLRTHTSPVQIRTMKSVPLPIRVIMPGRTYRCDSDQTHTPMFHQCEGLVVDKGSHMGHLKWILAEFCRAFFEVEKVEMRLRPSFFPFTEPSVEVDIRCDRSGKEIKIGEGDDWLEILGCGMVHPNVLRNCGIDPDEYQGFAWGMGLDRLAMLKYGAPDLRQFFENDQRWIRHYGFKPFDIPTLFGGLSA